MYLWILACSSEVAAPLSYYYVTQGSGKHSSEHIYVPFASHSCLKVLLFLYTRFVSQDSQWMPKTTDSNEPHMYYFFLCVYTDSYLW